MSQFRNLQALVQERVEMRRRIQRQQAQMRPTTLHPSFTGRLTTREPNIQGRVVSDHYIGDGAAAYQATMDKIKAITDSWGVEEELKVADGL